MPITLAFRFRLFSIYAPSLLFLAYIFGVPSAAIAGNALENAIERAKPCSALKVKLIGASVGVDNFKNVTIENIDIHVKGNQATANATGSLTCRTSDNAAFKGDVSARVAVDAKIDLSTCNIAHKSVSVLSASGTFGPIVDALAGQISQTLGDGLENEARKLCQ
ncbi:hypothetical protein [Rhizobium acidisoli]|uniref:hypothetical protein n=1 Tax=Rhizobium acidisoli TaxID=1538158 RepID=UPI000B02E00A|nr:hypothetical protein [Rhizobium acidisoli]